MTKKIYVITGGTLAHVSPHFSLCAPSYGSVGRDIFNKISKKIDSHLDTKNNYSVHLIKTRMAGRNKDTHILDILKNLNIKNLETNDDLSRVINFIKSKEDTRCIILSSAVCDFEPKSLTTWDSNFKTEFGKNEKRLDSDKDIALFLKPSNKLIDTIRIERKDIFLVSFKATSGLDKQEAYAKALRNLKRSSSNLVFVNDIKNNHNGVVTPEEFPYWGDSREHALDILCDMTLKRLNLTFEKTIVLSQERVPIKPFEDYGQVPKNFLDVMRYLINNKAFKHFNGKTSGHFGCKIIDDKHPLFERLCSVRKSDHNTIFETGLCGLYRKRGPNGELTFAGGKPSVEEHTQDNIYAKYGERVHAIVHFHCPIKDGSVVPVAEQFPYECGSNECGDNTSKNMKNMDVGIYAVHLEGHGPNIAFHKNVPYENIVKFIEENWDLSKKTGGIV
jgi:hypothetical protein